MTLDLGELVGYLVVDDKRWNFDGALKSMDRFSDRAKAGAKVAGDRAGEAFGDSLVPEAERAGEDAGEAAGDGFLSKSKLGAAAAGAAFGGAFWEALDLGAAQDKLVAQLGANARQAERYGRVAGHLYSNAWGDSMDQVNEAIASVVTSIDGMDDASGRQLGRLTSRALDFATAFELDIPRSVQVADTIIESKLAKNGLRAFDLLTRGAQKVPTALREDLLDAVEEYGQFFHSLGYSGPQAFALLVDASEKGIYGIDKAGDAVKEFTIRATDGSKPVGLALEMIGLNAGKMSNDLLAGGDTAQEATQKIIKGLLDIEDPSLRAQTAITLFGTPLEDLNVNEIPDFLRNLQAGSDTMDGFRGSSKRMSDDLNGNARTSVTEFTRTMKTELVGYLEDKVIPVLEDDVIPAVRDFAGWFDKEGGPALRDFKDDLDPVVDAVSDLAGFLNDMPGEAKIVALAGLLTGIGAVKVRGGGNGLAGTVGTALGLAKPVPVFVTNPGFGGPDGMPGTGGKPGRSPSSLAPLLSTLGFAGFAGIGTQLSNEYLANTAGSDVAVSMAGPQSQGGGGGLGAPPGFFDFNPDEPVDKSEQRTQRLRDFYVAGDLATETAERLGVVTDANVGKFDAFYRSTGKAEGAVDDIRGSLDLLSQIRATPDIELTGIERAMGQLATLNAGLDALVERGVDNGVPYLHGGSRGSQEGPDRGVAPRSPFDGATFNVQPPNYDAFMGDLQQRSRSAALGGRPAPGGRR